MSQFDETLDSKDDFSALYGVSSDSNEFVRRHYQCPICGSNVHFTHITDFTRNVTQETSRCPECGIRLRRVMHRLQ